jgi:hypothetical protein
MNGLDEILAILTLVLILVFFPLWQFTEMNGEIKREALKSVSVENKEEADYVNKAAEILGIDACYVKLHIEGKRNSGLYPYIFREYDVKEKERGVMEHYDF